MQIFKKCIKVAAVLIFAAAILSCSKKDGSKNSSGSETDQETETRSLPQKKETETKKVENFIPKTLLKPFQKTEQPLPAADKALQPQLLQKNTTLQE